MPGLPAPAVRSSRLAVALAVLAVLVSGQAMAQQIPESDMLEYLGSWQTDDGSAVDPFHLEDVQDLEPELAQTDVKAGEQSQKNLTDRVKEERRMRSQPPASGTEKDAKRRGAMPGGGHE